MSRTSIELSTGPTAPLKSTKQLRDGSVPVGAVFSREKWNESTRQICRLLAAYWSFMFLGANDASTGALIPYLQLYYHQNYTRISLIFLAQVVGYVSSALSNNFVHRRLGQRGITGIGGLCQITAFIIFCLHPPFPALIAVVILIGYGEGLKNAAWNSWIGNLANANELLGFLHGFYGLGATLSPIVATLISTREGGHWYQFYYILVGGIAIDLLISLPAFWDRDGASFRQSTKSTDLASAHDTPADPAQEHAAQARLESQGVRARLRRSRTLLIIKQKPVWICSAFLLAYVGGEVALGGWIVTFMLRIRHGTKVASGLVSTGFWAGITVGRVVLGFVTPRLFKNVKQAISTYLILAAILQLLFWLVPSFVVSAAMAALLGFFLAPLFPAIVVVLSRLLPAQDQVPAMGFCSALGASGAAVIPFMVGAIAQARGVQALQPIILSLLIVDLGLWLWLPTVPKERTH